MTLLCASLFLCGQIQPPVVQMPDTSLVLTGNLSEYADGVMYRTIQHQLEHNVISQERVNQADLFIAVYYCEHLNKFATVTYDGIEYLALITDCANVAHDRTREFFNAGVIAEVDYAFAAEHDLQENGRFAEIIIHE